jgi:2,3-bisphosphoglycerate-dependent phosphoglycerate mutase
VLQAQRLGVHLAGRRKQIGSVVKVFASDLQRASKTADAIIQAQMTEIGATAIPKVLVPDMRERDFRSWEGRTYMKRSADGADKLRHPDAETHEEMQVRVGRFVAQQLVPALLSPPAAESDTGLESATIVIVAHGLILNVLLRTLLQDYAPAELAKMSSPEHLTSWKNTGYLEARVVHTSKAASSGAAESTVIDAATLSAKGISSASLTFVIKRINCIEHLQGLKKTRGGIGSSQFDAKQKTMDSFFKPAAMKRKAVEDLPR